MEEEKFLTSGQAAKILGIHQDTLRNWDKTGKLKPHHVSTTGYKYYTLSQIKLIANVTESDCKVSTVSKKSPVSTIAKPSKSPKHPSRETRETKPLFKIYVDSGSGKSCVNCYSMRSGKTNSLAFANSPKLFSRITQSVGGQEIISEDDEYQFVETMHGVTVTVGAKDIGNVNAAIAKGVLWIQLAFTDRLGCDHPTDEVIEEARYMKWNIDSYMAACGLVDRDKAILSIKKILTLLSQAEIQWEEEIIVRNEQGKPIYSSGYRNKNGKYFSKVRKEKHTFRGSFISTRDLHPVNGNFSYWINKEFATYLAHAGVIAVNQDIFKIDIQKNAGALPLATKLSEYFSMNKGDKQANVIRVKSLLNAMSSIPKYESLTTQQVVKKDNGEDTVYERHGSKGGWRTRIKKPFENAFEILVNDGILKEWHYRENVEPKSYDEFEEQFIYFTFNFEME